MGDNPTELLDFNDFLKVNIRVGTVVRSEAFPEARCPALKLWIDFGEEIGVLKSSAQITVYYSAEVLIGRQVIAVVNLPEKQIGPVKSQCLVLGVSDAEGAIILLSPDQTAPNGKPVG